MKYALCIVLLALAGTQVFSQSLTEVSRTKIVFGPGDSQVGVEKGGGEHWKPLFFSVDKDGIVHIPDFYKNRIALFDVKGKLVKSLPVKEGISPRMNYFALAQNGRYVTFGDYTLYLLAKDGALVWKRQFGYGAIPENLYANGVGVFLVLPGEDSRAIVFDYASDRPLGRYGFMDGKVGVPMIRTESKGSFTFSLSEMPKIPDSGFPKSAFVLPTDAFLVSVDGTNRSLWKKRHEGSEDLYLFSATGTLLKQATLSYLESATEGNGFWTFADADMSVYKNYFYEDYVLIVKYVFK